MKQFDPSKDTLLISSNKKPLSYRGMKLMVRVNKYKVAGPVHVVGVILPDENGVRLRADATMTVEYDQNRAAAMRRIKKRIDDHLRDVEERAMKARLDAVYPLDKGVNGERLQRGIAQLDAGQGVERELIDDGDVPEHFCHAVDEHLAASLRTDDPMAEVIPDPEERSDYVHSRF